MSTRNVSLTCLARYSVMYYVQDTSMPNVICLPGVALDVLRTSAPVLRTTHTPNTRVVRCKTWPHPSLPRTRCSPHPQVIQARQTHMPSDRGALPASISPPPIRPSAPAAGVCALRLIAAWAGWAGGLLALVWLATGVALLTERQPASDYLPC